MTDEEAFELLGEVMADAMADRPMRNRERWVSEGMDGGLMYMSRGYCDYLPGEAWIWRR